jgi:protein-L-isoaspartate O-methyltransferase
VDQLRTGGRMIIPVGEKNGDQWLVQVDKGADGTTETDLMGVRYVPLVQVAQVQGAQQQ